MNRRTRRARRRLRRGDGPEPLLLIADDRADLIDAAALLGRIGYRYRSELLPPAVASLLAVTGALLHGHQITPWRWCCSASPSQLACAGRGSPRCWTR